MVGIFASQNNSGPFSNLRDTSPGSGEMDLSPGPSTGSSNDNRHQHSSPGATNASHSGGGSSSRTSYTPSSYDDNGTSNNRPPTPHQHQTTGYRFPPQATNFASTNSSAGFISRTEGQYIPASQVSADATDMKTDTSFVLPPGTWDFDGNVTDMPPSTEGMFTQMMEVAWDESAYVASTALGNNDS